MKSQSVAVLLLAEALLMMLSDLSRSALASPLWTKVLQQSPEGIEQLVDAGILVPCRSDDDCDMGMFCDTHYGFCDALRGEKEACRQDRHCKDRLICLFGKCQSTPSAGQAGARCETQSDCRPDLCCARTKGEKLCKPRLSLGEKCFVPQGGLDYILNEVCPCETGLVCTASDERQHQRKRNKEFDFVENYDHLRCSLPKQTLPLDDPLL